MRVYCYISNCTDDPVHTEDKRSLYGAHNFIVVSGKSTFGLFFDYPSKLTFDIGYDRERKEITFPVRDIEGRCVFVAGRSTERKFFRLPKGADKPIYCADKFRAGTYRTAYITESFLNCLTCWKYNKSAMAMIGTGNRKQYEILNELPVREYILAFDPDEAGRQATERFKKNVHGKIIKELVYTDNRDINDLQEEFLNCKIIF